MIEIALALILHPTRPEVLIARRKKGTHLAEYWELPGGKVEPDETIDACAVREAREETGLEVVVIEPWSAVDYEYPERTVRLNPVVCRALSDDAQPLESDQIAWAGAAELAAYRFPPANDSILARLVRLLDCLEVSP